MECLFVGSGGSVNSGKRHNTSLLFRTAASSVLIDCNGVCIQRLTDAKHDFALLEHIFLTHEHIDHVAAINNLLHQMWVKGCLYSAVCRTATLHIYGNAQTIARVKLLMDAVGLPAHPKIFPLEFHVLNDEGGTLDVGDIRLTYFPVDHGPTPCFGLALPGLVYSGDTEPVPSIYNRLQDGDILIHDCNKIDLALNAEHTTWKQLEAMRPDWPKIRLYLVHLPLMTDSQETQFSAMLEDRYQGDIRLANDGEIISVMVA